MRNNIVTTLPLVNSDGIVCCVLCGKQPVVLPMIIVPDRDPIVEAGEEDVSFITYICSDHADNLAQTQKEIEDKGLLWRMSQERKAMIH